MSKIQTHWSGFGNFKNQYDTVFWSNSGYTNKNRSSNTGWILQVSAKLSFLCEPWGFFPNKRWKLKSYFSKCLDCPLHTRPTAFSRGHFFGLGYWDPCHANWNLSVERSYPPLRNIGKWGSGYSWRLPHVSDHLHRLTLPRYQLQ